MIIQLLPSFGRGTLNNQKGYSELRVAVSRQCDQLAAGHATWNANLWTIIYGASFGAGTVWLQLLFWSLSILTFLSFLVGVMLGVIMTIIPAVSAEFRWYKRFQQLEENHKVVVIPDDFWAFLSVVLTEHDLSDDEKMEVLEVSIEDTWTLINDKWPLFTRTKIPTGNGEFIQKLVEKAERDLKTVQQHLTEEINRLAKLREKELNEAQRIRELEEAEVKRQAQLDSEAAARNISAQNAGTMRALGLDK